MKNLMFQVKQFVQDEEGATAVEYGVMVALIIAVCIAVIASIGTHLKDAFQTVDDKLQAAAPAPAG